MEVFTMNVFDSIVLVAAFLWTFAMGASFIAALDWNGIIEAWCFQITIPAAIASQMVMFLRCFFVLNYCDSEHD